MQYQQTHSAENALMYPIYDRVVDRGMGGMSPPRQNVRRGQDFLGQAMLGLILSSRAHRDRVTQQFGEASRNGAVHAAWVALGHGGAISFGLFVKVLAPHGDADR
jgi:hypothetical protein